MPPPAALTLAPALTQRASPALVAFAELLVQPWGELDELVAHELADNPALERRDEPPLVPGGRTEPARDPGALAADEPTAAEVLLADARLLLEPPDHPLAALLVAELDEHGFLPHGAHDRRVARVLAALREAGPCWIGARDARECLLLQIERRERDDGRAYRLQRLLVRDHLEALARGALGRIAAATGTTRAEVEAARDWLRRELTPYPGFAGSARQPPPVVPDVVIARRRDEPAALDVEVAGADGLAVSALYERLERDDPGVRRDVERARAFLARLAERRATLRRVAAATVARQRPFVDGAPAALQPLTRAQVAADVGVHESTVSRAVAGKHVQLPCGRVVPFSGFFQAAAPVRDALVRLVAEEPRPLSDGELAAALADRGHRVARRTVAKYRGQLGILPQALR